MVTDSGLFDYLGLGRSSGHSLSLSSWHGQHTTKVLHFSHSHAGQKGCIDGLTREFMMGEGNRVAIVIMSTFTKRPGHHAHG